MKNYRWLLVALSIVLPGTGLAAPLKVVASILPIHALVAGGMHGLGEPHLLVAGSTSPHHYTLRPSDARALAEADAVFWIGPILEGFLTKSLAHPRNGQQVVALSEIPGITLLPLRRGGAWAPHPPSQADDSNSTATPQHVAYDPHIWLDPANAIVMIQQIATTLSALDPAHQADYARNGTALSKRLQELERRLAHQLAPVRHQPYVVFHDAYQYFERRYDLRAVGSVVLDPEQQPGAKRVAAIQQHLREQNVRCVFSEPQFQPALVHTLVAQSSVRVGMLDPLGAELPPGSEAYFILLEKLATTLRNCLQE